jgi:hypothetical protein
MSLPIIISLAAAATGVGLFAFTKGKSLLEKVEHLKFAINGKMKLRGKQAWARNGFWVDVSLLLDNPTGKESKLMLPRVEIKYAGSNIASTLANSNVYTIPAYGQGKISLTFESSILQLVSGGGRFAMDMKNNGANLLNINAVMAAFGKCAENVTLDMIVHMDGIPVNINNVKPFAE